MGCQLTRSGRNLEHCYLLDGSQASAEIGDGGCQLSKVCDSGILKILTTCLQIPESHLQNSERCEDESANKGSTSAKCMCMDLFENPHPTPTLAHTYRDVSLDLDGSILGAVCIG